MMGGGMRLIQWQRIRNIMLGTACLLMLGAASPVAALTPVDYAPNVSLPDVYITAFSSDAMGLTYVELYNNSSSAVDMRGWQVRYKFNDSSEWHATVLDRYLLPKDFGLLAVGEDDELIRPLEVVMLDTDDPARFVSAVELLKFAENTETLMRVTDIQPHHTLLYRRALTTTYANERADTVFTATRPAYHSAGELFVGGWYMPPSDSNQVKIAEIVANPRACSPLESVLDCADYVKVFVGDMSFEDIAQYALRTDSGGTKRTASNGHDLANFPVTDEGYITVPVAVTNIGGYAWIEDTYGTQRYDDTVVQYPDASSTTKRGYAWALSESGGWQWTATPRPDAANSFYLPPEPIKVAASATLTPCREGQERNPATNRCRSIVDAIAELVPCREGQERNPATNRCRSVLAASSALVPCQDGYERNPETNRCRKVVLASSNIPAVKDVETKSKASTTGWLVASVAVALAGGYALYEWRDDIRRRFSRIK